MGDASVYQTELAAIEAIACSLLQRKTEGRHVRIFSDSKSGLQSLMKSRISSKLTEACVKALNELGKSNIVKLIWVPGHTGIQGNEEADRLAKEGTKMEVIGPEPIIFPPKDKQVSVFRKRTTQDHEARWRKLQDKCKHAKRALSKPTRSSEAKTVVGMPRKDLRRLIGVLTGHCTLKEHLFKLGLKETPFCEACHNKKETPYHVCGECPRFFLQRLVHLGAVYLEERDLWKKPWRRIMAFVKSSKCLEVSYQDSSGTQDASNTQ